MPRHLSTALLPLLLLAGCVAPVDAPSLEDADLGVQRSSLTASQRRARAGQIRDAAAAVGMTQGYLLAGIADSETTMAHCWSEATWACRGPHSSDCGGPVIAGAGDGPCSIQQGGLGMFQFDAGTYSQTLAREGNRILSIAGNVQAAVDFVIGMVIRSQYIAGVSTREQAIAWMNGVRVGNGRYVPWIKTVTRYYNGCSETSSCWSNRYPRYRDHTTNIYNEMGASFWTVNQCEASCLDGRRIQSADCGVGDCGVYGARCVDDSLGARCVAAFCEARGVQRHCLDEDTLLTCTDGAQSTGSCGAYGARCVEDELGARCASVFCPERGDAQSCLPDGDTLITCHDGGIAGSGSCAAFGARCVVDELGGRCASVFCPDRGRTNVCVPDSEVLFECEDGGIREGIDCGDLGGTCVEDGAGSAHCASELCDSTGAHSTCASATSRIECDGGGVTDLQDCGAFGGACVDDGEEATCVFCGEGEPAARCVGEAAIARCDQGATSIEECPVGTVCSEGSGGPTCAAPPATEPPPTPPPAGEEPPPEEPREPDPGARPDVMGGCSVGAPSPRSGLAWLALAALGLALRRRTR